jgi:senataxin
VLSPLIDPFEAQAVKRLLLGDRDVQAVLNEVQHATTMIITPYRAQVDLITQQLSRENMMTNIKIDTVDSFQGQEADVVIFSAVRTESEGFVNDEQRINVALTRAKRVLRIVGNIFFWSKTSYGSPMRRLAEHCESSGLVKSDEKLGKRAEALLKPSWNGIDKFTWKPTMVCE